jgi:hypothetical protein
MTKKNSKIYSFSNYTLKLWNGTSGLLLEAPTHKIKYKMSIHYKHRVYQFHSIIRILGRKDSQRSINPLKDL